MPRIFAALRIVASSPVSGSAGGWKRGNGKATELGDGILFGANTEGSSSFVASTAASIATGWSEPVPGRDFHPLWTSAFSRRTELSRLVVCGLPDQRYRLGLNYP